MKKNLIVTGIIGTLLIGGGITGFIVTKQKLKALSNQLASLNERALVELEKTGSISEETQTSIANIEEALKKFKK